MTQSFRHLLDRSPKEILDALNKDIKAKARSNALYERRTIQIPLGGIAAPRVKVGER
jgi:hypothetical protein